VKVGRGFSLLEILVGIVLIFILSFISLKSFLKYKNKAIISNVQGNLVSCASELMAEYASEGTRKKVCVIPNIDQVCTLIVSSSNDTIKIATSYCDFSINGKKIRCEIRTNYGDVNGRIDCYPIK